MNNRKTGIGKGWQWRKQYGGHHGNYSWKGNAELIKAIREKLYEPEFSDLSVSDFSDLAQSCKTYEEFISRMELVSERELNYFGIAICGAKKKVNKLTGSMPLLWNAVSKKIVFFCNILHKRIIYPTVKNTDGCGISFKYFICKRIYDILSHSVYPLPKKIRTCNFILLL